MNRTTKLTLVIFAFALVVLYVSFQSGTISMDWNGLFNGTLQSLMALLVGIPVTIWVYRYMYHRRSKK